MASKKTSCCRYSDIPPILPSLLIFQRHPSPYVTPRSPHTPQSSHSTPAHSPSTFLSQPQFQYFTPPPPLSLSLSLARSLDKGVEEELSPVSRLWSRTCSQRMRESYSCPLQTWPGCHPPDTLLTIPPPSASTTWPPGNPRQPSWVSP